LYIPNKSKTYNNTIHAQFLKFGKGIDYEMGSSTIMNDVKFSHSIGNGTHCNSQQRRDSLNRIFEYL